MKDCEFIPQPQIVWQTIAFSRNILTCKDVSNWFRLAFIAPCCAVVPARVSVELDIGFVAHDYTVRSKHRTIQLSHSGSERYILFHTAFRLLHLPICSEIQISKCQFLWKHTALRSSSSTHLQYTPIWTRISFFLPVFSLSANVLSSPNFLVAVCTTFDSYFFHFCQLSQWHPGFYTIFRRCSAERTCILTQTVGNSTLATLSHHMAK